VIIITSHRFIHDHHPHHITIIDSFPVIFKITSTYLWKRRQNPHPNWSTSTKRPH